MPRPANGCSRPSRRPDREQLSASLNQVASRPIGRRKSFAALRRFVTKAKPVQALVDLNAIDSRRGRIDEHRRATGRGRGGFELTEPLPPVVGDRIQLEQVMVNLMRNGFDAMRDCRREFRRLTIRTTIDGAQKHRGRRGVTTARGIPPDAIDRVFDRFFTTKPDGMGMGLPISQSIIANHGGKLVGHAQCRSGQHLPFHLAD